ncbi:spore germination cell wall hydrolase CwlJ-like protein [Sphingomonas insulae]|uniref:Cell wall hydrolase SleB domain-containing protein n=1 Tax=Sphingomonas insulae TaxID=424800 RepID=A0ABN1I049_9SPHN|nr:cell wall hydrolase [Sphingomonas insulae]NIJ30505.1 spore germination cell wall hydrolase CwlJ-like protein [Sphingomonas insulae]
MAQRRSPTPRRASRRRARRDLSSERWLLLLGIATLIAIFAGAIGPWPVVAPADDARPLTMAEARLSNAAVPIDVGRRLRAARYRFRGGPAAREQAIECLATAALYEAGDDRRGQRAVIQVILNRVRAPGFAKTVCGVVYQGATRATGCQFSFTCDGSFRRRPVHVGWGAARRAARRALAGDVFADVGRATHYHTDWMVPYWRDSLVKIARVGTHLFYVRS